MNGRSFLRGAVLVVAGGLAAAVRAADLPDCETARTRIEDGSTLNVRVGETRSAVGLAGEPRCPPRDGRVENVAADRVSGGRCRVRNVVGDVEGRPAEGRTMGVFEFLMLVCFGVSWPFSILKSLRSRSAKGKSIMFMALVELGYVFGIVHKLLYSNNWVIWAYLALFIVVGVDIVLYFRNARLDRLRGK